MDTIPSTETPPPHAPMAEKSIISSMMHSPDDFIRRALGDGLKSDMFHLFANLFDLIVTDYRDRKSFDLTVFIQALALAGELDRLGGPSAITDIYTYDVSNGSNWTHVVGQLRETYALRLAMQRATELSKAEDSASAISLAESALDALRAAVRGPKRASTAKESINEFIERIKAAHEAGDLPGSATGIHDIDAISGGMREGELWVIGGKSSRGKSALMFQITLASLLRGETSVIFSLEMMRHEIIGRLASNLGKINYGCITQPRTATKGDLQGTTNALARLINQPFFIDDTAGQNIETIRNEALRIRDANGGKMGLVVVDYVQLIRGERGRSESREQEVARASGALKQLAKELRCPVITATQLNADGQSRESRAIEQDADALLYIVEDEGVCVVKMRNAQRDQMLPLFLDGKHQRFTSVRQSN